jgi:hypothetical protein
MHGPTRIFGDNLTPLSLQATSHSREWISTSTAMAYVDELLNTEVRKTPSRPRSWANFSPLDPHSHSLECMGQPCTFWANLTPFPLKDEALRRLVEEIRWTVVPVLNPDGDDSPGR